MVSKYIFRRYWFVIKGKIVITVKKSGKHHLNQVIKVWTPVIRETNIMYTLIWCTKKEQHNFSDPLGLTAQPQTKYMKTHSTNQNWETAYWEKPDWCFSKVSGSSTRLTQWLTSCHRDKEIKEVWQLNGNLDSKKKVFLEQLVKIKYVF